MSEKPNILFLMTDQHRFDCMGFMKSVLKTPNLDRLAEQSIVFTNAYTTNPSCIPARAAIFTGKYPSGCHCPTYTSSLPNNEITFMELLQTAGYYTAVIGKQHFSESGINRGYDYEDIIDEHTFKINANGQNENISSYAKYILDAGFSDSRELMTQETPYKAFRWIVDEKYHLDSYVGRKGSDWIREKMPEDAPWFLCISFPGPHTPYDGEGTKYADLYPLDQIDPPHADRACIEDKPPHFKSKSKMFKETFQCEEMIMEDIQKLKRSYYANISLIDKQIGEILTALEEKGQFDNTVIVFTSDHGDFMGDYGFILKGQYLSEVLMRVPFILKPPVKEFEGGKLEHLISTVDIPATFLALAKAEVPQYMAGMDLSVYWDKPEHGVSREALYMEAGALRGIRTKKWKLVYYTGKPYGELYDLMNDPWETKNLWDDRNLLPIRENLKTLLLEHMVKSDPLWDTEWSGGAPEI